MKFDLQKDDAFAVLSSTKPVVENLHFVRIHNEKIEMIAKQCEVEIKKGFGNANDHFGNAKTLEDHMQLIFLLDCINFCFWAEKDKPVWEVAFPKKEAPNGGWYGLTKCFAKALHNKIPLLDAAFLSKLTLPKAREIFVGQDNVEIPLLPERVRNLVEAGKVLLKKYDGKFIRVLEKAQYDVLNLVPLLYKDFSSFRDYSLFNGEKVYFLKRAQICAQDLSYLSTIYKEFEMKHLDSVTAFADYKVPQMLRYFGAISYTIDLANKIDTKTLIKKDSREEIEIRAATIWCVEKMRQVNDAYTAAQLDNALWQISQNNIGILPYHRTKTIFY